MSSNKFWEADDILMTNEIVTGIAETDICGINFHDKSTGLGYFTEDNVTREGNKLEVPLWFAAVLKEQQSAGIKQPKYMTDKYYNLLSADPTFVNIKSKNFYFYEISSKLSSYIDQEEQKWPKLLAAVIHRRFLYFLRNSSNVIYENHSLAKIISLREKLFYDKMVKINKNVKFFLENYENNNKNLDELVEAKKMSKKVKKTN
jgi:hypothetical protein